MEGHIIFAHELRIGNILRAFIGAPPTLPVAAFAGILPFLRTGNIFDRRVKPDIEHFVFHAGPRLFAFTHWNAPIQIAGDAAILQAIAVI